MKMILVYFALCWVSGNSVISNLEIRENNDFGDIIVHVDKVDVNRGTLYVGLFDSKRTFRKVNKVYKFQEVPADAKTRMVTLKDVPFNEYALVIFQDYNENHKFDKSLMGLPKEPFGFSTNFIVKTRAPKYKDVTFTHDQNNTVLYVILQTL